MLRVEGVSKTFRGRQGGATEAIRDVSFSAGEKEFVCVVGPSGCGKTTLLRLIAGLTEPSAGSVLLNGRTVDGPIQDVGFVFQRALLMQWRNSLENVLLPVELRHIDRRPYISKASALLDLFGLSGFHAKYPRELSGGMQQRVSIARAMIQDPSLLLMDEPLGSLDELTRDQMAFELIRLREAMGKTVVLVTHSITEAVLLADRVLVLSPRPSTVRGWVDVDLERPRSDMTRVEPRYAAYCQKVREMLKGTS